MHSDDRDVEPKGNQLQNQKIDLIVSGGIAATESPKLIRELRRYGAEVRVFMTAAATEFVRPRVFEWASKNSVITDLSGSAEHITNSDAVIVAPCTLDFLGKIANGLADSAASTLVQSALAHLPIFLAPSMHSSLEKNPAYLKNREFLGSLKNIHFLQADHAEGKAKMMGFEVMAAKISHSLCRSPLRGKKVLLTLGATRSAIDDVRFVSNYSTGALGMAIADEFYRAGADVIAIAGSIQVPALPYISLQTATTHSEMAEKLKILSAQEKPAIGIFSAAILDYEVASPRDGKTSSAEKLSFELTPTAKLIQNLNYTFDIQVGFKLESRISKNELQECVQEWAEKNQSDFVVANRLEEVGPSLHKAMIYSRVNKSFVEADTKIEIARALRKLLEENLNL